ncbi:MAG: AbrB/MazE/SpoVT family DNA-binding domain-containing protein [Deferrisomatales bacterium]|nr:AbrB/MazE/SpoVT family DNA-binding domain-containing protein [Deferrisomatales bacterium]
MLATVTSKGQVTIPKAIRDLLHLQPNDRVDFAVEEGQVVLKPVQTLRDLRGAVPAAGKGDFAEQRARARAAVGRRVREEME